jgi:hypothetical protein
MRCNGIIHNNIKSGALYHNKCSSFKTFVKVQNKRIGRWINLLKEYNLFHILLRHKIVRCASIVIEAITSY